MDDIKQPQSELPEKPDNGPFWSMVKQNVVKGPLWLKIIAIPAPFLMLISLVIGIAIYFAMLKIREPAPVTYAGGYSGGSLGCTLSDDAFTQKLEMSADDVIAKINDNGLKRNLEQGKNNLQKIIDKGNNSGVNPAVLIAIWAGEQSFKNDENSLKKAMGCGVFDTDNDKDIDNLFPRFEANADGKGQIECSIDCIKKAINETPPYSNPSGEDIFTRLFFNYTWTMKRTYKEKNYVADESNTRIKILKMLLPDQVVCRSGQGGLAIPYYSQGYGSPSPPWAGKTQAQNDTWIFQSHHTLKAAGCGITSVAMVVSYFRGDEYTPSRVADEIIAKCGEGCGSDFGKYTGGGRSVVTQLYGINISRDSPISYSSGGEFPKSWVQAQLNNNHPLILRVLPGSTLKGHTYSKGHYLVIRGINQSGNLIINEPVYPEKKEASIDSLVGSFELYSVSG